MWPTQLRICSKPTTKFGHNRPGVNRFRPRSDRTNPKSLSHHKLFDAPPRACPNPPLVVHAPTHPPRSWPNPLAMWTCQRGARNEPERHQTQRIAKGKERRTRLGITKRYALARNRISQFLFFERAHGCAQKREIMTPILHFLPTGAFRAQGG